MILLLFFFLWVLGRYLDHKDITPKGLAISCWEWLSMPGSCLFLGFLVGLNLMNLRLDSMGSMIIYVLLLTVFINKVERPFNTLIKPAWYLGTLSLMFLCACFLTSFKHSKYVDDGKNDLIIKS